MSVDLKITFSCAFCLQLLLLNSTCATQLVTIPCVTPESHWGESEKPHPGCCSVLSSFRAGHSDPGGLFQPHRFPVRATSRTCSRTGTWFPWHTPRPPGPTRPLGRGENIFPNKHTNTPAALCLQRPGIAPKMWENTGIWGAESGHCSGQLG